MKPKDCPYKEDTPCGKTTCSGCEVYLRLKYDCMPDEPHSPEPSYHHQNSVLGARV